MSTNRNISTLPLDALRSVSPPTAHHEDQRPLSSNRDQFFSNSISDQNLQLCVENQKLRRCLSLFLENSSLKTANALSTIISLCDDKLRSFITEKIIEVPDNRAAEKFKPDVVYSPQQLDQANDKPIDASNSYGMSFQNIDINDLGNDTFDSYRNKSSKSASPRTSYSSASKSGSLRPPMRFGVGKSPYNKSPVRSPTVRSFSPSSQSYSVQQATQSKPKSKNSKRGKYSNHSNLMYETSITKRPSSAPPIRKIVVNNGEFKVNKNSAFSKVKGKQQCKDCSLQSSHLCGLHSARSEKYKPSAAVGTSPTENSLPQLKNITQNQTPNSNYQTAQQLLYDSHDGYHGTYSENLIYQPSESTNKKIKHHFAKSVNWTQDPRKFEDKLLQTENVRRSFDNTAVVYDDYKRGTQISSDNNSTDEDLTLTKLHIENSLERKHPVVGPNAVQDSFVHRGTSTQTSIEQTTDIDIKEEIDAPQATSTPIPTQKQPRGIQRQESVLSNDSLAHVMGLKGPGLAEKAKYVLHRPLDVLISYHPEITEDAIISLGTSKPNERLLGEIAFQLDRRILEYVFAGINDKPNKRRSRYYGYSVASIMMLISKEVKRADNDPDLDSSLRSRLEHILNSLQPLSYDIQHHSEFTQDVVNKYGLLNGSPQPGTIEDMALQKPAVMRLLVGQLVSDEQELHHMLIILDCLHLMAHYDKRPVFTW